MKKVIIFLFFGSILIHAQKIAHVNIFEILERLPERKQALLILQKETETKKAIIKSLEEKFQNKAHMFRLKTEKFTELDFKNKSKMKATKKEQIALQEELKKIEGIKSEALKFLQKREADLNKPIENKIISSINKIAKLKGVSYVLDSSQQGIFLYIDSLSSNDLTSMIKSDLGVK